MNVNFDKCLRQEEMEFIHIDINCKEDGDAAEGPLPIAETNGVDLRCDATALEGQDLLCPSQYTRPLGTEVHEHMSRSGGQSEAEPPVLKSPSKLGINRSTAVGMKGHGTTPLRVKEDIEDDSSELGNGG
ncbi:hypothetical protein TNCV_3865521 [Trichonephila clavipes]|nr:hypothetical protein TNCV_3865521 [Trichonephila clavipes]